MGQLFGGGAAGSLLSGPDPIAPWGGYSGDQVGNAWRGAQGGMVGTDPIPQWGGYTGNQIGGAWQQAQEEPSLWDKLTKALGEIKPEDLRKVSQELGGDKKQPPPLTPASSLAAHAAGSMNPYHNIYSQLPLDPKQAYRRLMGGGVG